MSLQTTNQIENMATIRNSQQELNRGVLTLSASITTPDEFKEQEAAFLSLCNLAFVKAAANYAVSVEALTVDHNDLKKRKPPIDLEAEHEWCKITGTLKLGVHLCSDGPGILKDLFATEMPDSITRVVEHHFGHSRAESIIARLSGTGVIIFG